MSTQMIAKPEAGSSVIDCDAQPFLKEGWRIEDHQKSGSLTWDPGKAGLHLSDAQRDGRAIVGTKLLQELSRTTRFHAMNANVLDFLLSHPHLIPGEWRNGAKGQRIVSVYFWGTIYRDPNNRFCVPCFFWEVGLPERGHCQLDSYFGISSPAAILIA